MMAILKLSARNLMRYRRRTLLTAGLIMIGVVAMLLFVSAAGSFKQVMIGQITDSMLGHLQVHRRGYVASVDNLPLNLNLPAPIVERIVRQIASERGVAATSVRLKLGAAKPAAKAARKASGGVGGAAAGKSATQAAPQPAPRRAATKVAGEAPKRVETRKSEPKSAKASVKRPSTAIKSAVTKVVVPAAAKRAPAKKAAARTAPAKRAPARKPAAGKA